MSDAIRALTYVEIDVDYCSLVYGVAPCVAVVGTAEEVAAATATGTRKCFNTVATCQDAEHFTNVPVTLRFAKPANYLPREIECIPSITEIHMTPGVVSLGENLGQRATLAVTFEDHRHSDAGNGFDKYYAERDYNPATLGTFWGKFRARQPYLLGRPIRIIRGSVGDALADMDTRHYVIESFDGPTPEGLYTITAKDVLKLADGDRAQAPKLSNGFLVNAITNSDLTANLSPTGIGDFEYPASGFVAIGGKEICAFTRVANALTLTRGQHGTEAVAHDAQDRVQLCLQYTAQDPSAIIADLLENYAAVDGAFIPAADWLAETSTYLRRVYSALIAEPTSVNTLVSELIEQAALAVWWADDDQEIKLQVLRPILTTANEFSEDNILEGTLGTKEQPDKRLSQVWTYFGQINPLKKVDEPDNYRSTAATINATSELNYNAPAIKKIFSRWIPAFGRPVALRLNDIQLGRFTIPPRLFSFATMRGSDSDAALGGGYRIASWPLQDETGAPVDAPIQVTRLNAAEDRFEIEAEEALFAHQDPEDLTHRTIIIDSNVNDINLRDVHDQLYPALEAGNTITCTIETGVIVGSSNSANPAFDLGSWPGDVDITLIINGRVQGAGGKGGVGNDGAGIVGGTALKVARPIDLKVADGEIFGGGGGGGGGGRGSNGGGGGGGGGGGRGTVPAIGGEGGHEAGTGGDGAPGFPSTPEIPGMYGNGGAGGFGAGIVGGGGGRGGMGGDAGLPGEHGAAGGDNVFHNQTPGGPGGAGGVAIDGVSFITVLEGPGDIRGGQIN